jgi:hypothetical protein
MSSLAVNEKKVAVSLWSIRGGICTCLARH